MLLKMRSLFFVFLFCALVFVSPTEASSHSFTYPAIIVHVDGVSNNPTSVGVMADGDVILKEDDASAVLSVGEVGLKDGIVFTDCVIASTGETFSVRLRDGETMERVVDGVKVVFSAGEVEAPKWMQMLYRR